MKKKGVELSINTIILLVLFLIALVILVLIFTGSMKDISSSIWNKLKNALGLWNASEVKPIK